MYHGDSETEDVNGIGRGQLKGVVHKRLLCEALAFGEAQMMRRSQNLKSWGKSIPDRGTRKCQSLRLGQKKGLYSCRGASSGQGTVPEARQGLGPEPIGP